MKPSVKQSSRPDGGRLDIGKIRRDQIIASVRRIVASEGIDAVTIARIASDLGASRGVVTYHYENKEEILHDALQAAIQDASRSALAVAGENGTISDLTLKVTELATSDNDWWAIYVAFLGKARTAGFYAEEIAKADRAYRAELSRILENDIRAIVVLALMKGLAVQLLVDPNVAVAAALDEMRELLIGWDR